MPATAIVHVNNYKNNIFLNRTHGVSKSLAVAALVAGLNDNSLASGVAASEQNNNLSTLDTVIKHK
jgi:hypothetical protein